MKRVYGIFFALILSCVFLFSSCDSIDVHPNGESNNGEKESNTFSDQSAVCDHTFGDWDIFKQATCKEDGKRIRTCDKCSHVEEEVIQKNESHTPVTDAPVPATCKKTGLTEGSHCSLCDEVLVAQDVVPRTDDHTPVIDAPVPATCKKTGLTEGSHCSVCEKVFIKQEVIKQKEHIIVDFECTECGYVQASEGLEFVRNSTGYTLSGLGTFSESILSIPSTYNGKPVTEIAQCAIMPDFALRKIIIPSSVKNIRYNAIMVPSFCIIDLNGNVQIEEQALECYGGCEIINRSRANITDTVFCTMYENAPYIIHNTSAQKTEYTNEGFGFLQYKGKYYLCDFKGTSQSLTLPDSYNGNDYILAARCFYKSDVISEVVLGNGIIAIGEAAFAASSLEQIDLSCDISELPSFCFMECQQLTEIVIPLNITVIHNQCFYGSGLINVTIGTNVTNIDVSAFGSCPKLDTLWFNAANCTNVSQSALNGFKKLVIGSSAQSIPSKFMKGNTSLESITFEKNSSCKSIGAEAFDKASITEIQLPKSLTHIYAAFEDCTKLEKIVILCDNIQSNANAFYDCGSSGDGIVVTVAANVMLLPSNFLKDCKVKSLVFDGESKCKIIQASFSNRKFSNVTLPTSIESFDKSLFDLKTLSFEEGNENYTIKNSCLIALKESKLLAVIDEDYIIPDYVTVITKGAFYESGVKHIYIPDTVLTMENGSLCCPSVESISLPFIGNDRDNPKKLLELFGTDVQYGWIQIDLNAGTTRHERYYVPTKFSKLTVRSNSISNGLVGLSMLKEIHISEDVESIVQTAFKDCGNLTNIYFGGTQEQWDNLKTSGWLEYVSMNVNLTLNAEIET